MPLSPQEGHEVVYSNVTFYFKACKTTNSIYEFSNTTLFDTNTGFIAAGDFNPSSNSFDAKYLTKYCDVNLKQVVKASTRNSNVLDLIFTNILGFHVTS